MPAYFHRCWTVVANACWACILLKYPRKSSSAHSHVRIINQLKAVTLKTFVRSVSHPSMCIARCRWVENMKKIYHNNE